MQLTFSYRNVAKSLPLECHVVGNLVKLQEYFGDNAVGKVIFKKERKLHICELTIYRQGDVFRAEKKSEDMYNAVDLCTDTLWGTIRKYKSKIDKRRREKSRGKTLLAEGVETPLPEDNDGLIMQEMVQAIVGVKHKEVSPAIMSVADAINALELIGHDFYIFIDEKSDNTSILYRRDQEKYGKEAYGVIEVTN